MRILSYQNIEVPSSSAHSLYMVRGGAELSVGAPVDLIAARGKSRFAFEMLYGFDPEQYGRLKLHVPPVRQKGLSGLWRRLTARRLLRAETAPIVYISQAKPLRFFSHLTSRRRRFKLVLECHGVSEFAGEDMSALDGLICMSASLQQQCFEQFPALATLPNLVSFHWVDRAAAVPGRAELEALQAEPFVLCYVGSVLPWKGVDVLLNAARHLSAEYRVLVIGGSEEEEYRRGLIARAASEGLADRVEFVPFIPPAELVRATERANAFVLPLPGEAQGSMPMKLVEYLSWGRPVIASDLPSIREVIDHGVNGALFAPGSARELAEQARALAGMPVQAQLEMIEAGAQTLASFSVENWRANLLNWFAEL